MTAVTPRPQRPSTGTSPTAVVLRSVVYAVLVLSAAVTLLLGERLWMAFREGILPVWAPLLAPVAYTAFVLVYTLDRWFLVRARRFSASRALWQVAFCLIFVSLLVPHQATEMRQPKPPPPSGMALMQLLEHADEQVRASACELAQGSLAAPTFDKVVAMSHQDPSAAVRLACTQALGRAHLQAPLR